MINKISHNEIVKLISNDAIHISEKNKDEMAIPSYLHGNPLIRWLMWKRYESIAELSLLSKSKIMNVFEFGCGIGLFLPELAKSCHNIYATDLFPQYAKILCKNLNLDVSFIENISELANKSLDLIIAADVLEHITNLDQYLAEFNNKLNDQGRLIVSGPTENIFYKTGRLLAGFHDKGDYHHSNIDLLINTIEKFGFSLLKCKKLPSAFLPCLFKVCEFRKNPI